MGNSSSYSVNKKGNVVLENGLELNMNRENYRYMLLLQGYVTKIMLAIDKVCRENNITYYLGEGTLLGAVRHKGFIPWDDDADILMPREDYERFMVLAETELPEGFQIDSERTNPKHWSVHYYVQMTEKVPYVKKRLEGIALNIGPAVDVFPLDYVPDDRSEELAKRGNKLRILRRTLWIKSRFHKRSWYKTARRRFKHYYPLRHYGMFRSIKSLRREIYNVMTATNDKSLPYMCVFGSLYYARRETFKKEFFGTPQYAEFEGHMFPIPANPERILERIYGDYMQLPPVICRKSKHCFDFDDDIMNSLNDKEIYNVIKSIKQSESEEAICVSNTPEKKTGLIPEGITFIKNRFAFVGKYRRRFRRDRRSKALEKAFNTAVTKNTVLYFTYGNAPMSSGTSAVLKAMLTESRYSGFNHIVALSQHKYFNEFKNIPNVKFVNSDSVKFASLISTAKYVVYSFALPQFFEPRKDQICLNTGYTLPSLPLLCGGYGRRATVGADIFRSVLCSTHMVQSEMFRSNLKHGSAIFNGDSNMAVIADALPETDLIMNADGVTALNKLGIPNSKKLVLYAPLIAEKHFTKSQEPEIVAVFKKLQKKIDTEKYAVRLLKYSAESKELKKLCLPWQVGEAEAMAAAEVLITDYSLKCFSFLCTGKPVIFYRNKLLLDSGIKDEYIVDSELPGPLFKDTKSTVKYLDNLNTNAEKYSENYRKLSELALKNADGNAAKRIINFVFNKNSLAVEKRKVKTKEKLLFIADGTRSYIHQSHLIKLLSQLDYDKYDVTLITGAPRKKMQKDLVESINQNVKILLNNKWSNSKWSVRHRVYEGLRNGTESIESAAKTLAVDREWKRLAGNSTFDSLIMIQPNTSPFNWLLLSYGANVKNKYYVKSNSVLKTVYENEVALNHFEKVYESVEEIPELVCKECDPV